MQLYLELLRGLVTAPQHHVTCEQCHRQASLLRLLLLSMRLSLCNQGDGLDSIFRHMLKDMLACHGYSYCGGTIIRKLREIECVSKRPCVQ